MHTKIFQISTAIIKILLLSMFIDGNIAMTGIRNQVDNDRLDLPQFNSDRSALSSPDQLIRKVREIDLSDYPDKSRTTVAPDTGLAPIKILSDSAVDVVINPNDSAEELIQPESGSLAEASLGVLIILAGIGLIILALFFYKRYRSDKKLTEGHLQDETDE